MNFSSLRLRSIAFVVVSTACAKPTTQLGSVPAESITGEQLKQQQLVLANRIKQQQRLDDIQYPLLTAAAPLCQGRVTTERGLWVANVYSFGDKGREAASAMGFSDTLTVVGVASGSAAAKAGFRVGDRIVGVGGQYAPIGAQAVPAYHFRVTQLTPHNQGEPASAPGAVSFRVRRGPPVTAHVSAETLPSADSVPDAAVTEEELNVAPDSVCMSAAVAVKSDVLNAFADGVFVYITTAMMRFAADDEELAVVVAHELAHNAMRHMDAKKKNSTFGAILGAVVDVAAATQGVSTGGAFTNKGADLGARTFSQSFEREADYVGMYILARAGRPIATAPNFWRRMAQESPGSIKFASSHPTTAERYVRLEQAVAEIEQKRSAGVELMPELKKEGTTDQK